MVSGFALSAQQLQQRLQGLFLQKKNLRNIIREYNVCVCAGAELLRVNVNLVSDMKMRVSMHPGVRENVIKMITNQNSDV